MNTKKPSRQDFVKGINKTTLENALELMQPLGKNITERLIRESSPRTHEGFPSKEKSKMNKEFITIDGQRYRLTPADKESAETGIRFLKAGMGNVNLTAKVATDWGLNVFTRKNDGSEGRVHSFLLSDNSGSIKAALWDSHTEVATKIKEGDTILITNGYVKDGLKKENTQFIEIHVGKFSDVVIVPQEEQHIL